MKLSAFLFCLAVAILGCICASARAQETNATPVAIEKSDPNVFWIDRMEKSKNLLEGRCAPYQKLPSQVLVTKGPEYGKEGGGLKLAYKQVSVGGPYGKGGWCGYYTALKRGEKYFDASAYTHLTFWVRGETGGERFQVGMADKQFGMVEDSVKARAIESYLPSKKITTEWQKAMIPLNDMFVDYRLVDAISINFEADLFEDEQTSGVVYIDDLAFEKLSEEQK
jgi:hypothetical protein